MISLPKDIRSFHTSIVLLLDYLVVQGKAIYHSYSCGYGSRTVDSTGESRKVNSQSTIERTMKVIGLYNNRCITIKQINADKEFECIRDHIRPSLLNIVAADEHVGDIERSIRTVKEATRCHVQRLPYFRYPKVMVIGFVVHSVKQLNDLLGDNNVSNILNPNSMIIGTPTPDCAEVMILNFRDYVQVHKPQLIMNTNNPRSVGAIELSLIVIQIL
jgi:hypothetical protein